MRPPTLLGRRLLTALASLAASGMLAHSFFREIARHSDRKVETLFVLTMVAGPLVAGGLFWSRRLGAQLGARAIWWAYLLLGGLVAFVGPSIGPPFVPAALCAATALLAAGASNLEGGPGAFQPVAFRGTLLVALVLAIADTGSLLWFGLGEALFEGRPWVLFLIPPMAASAFGLLRLRTWGLMLGMASNLLVAGVALTDLVHLPRPLRALYLGTATLQLLIPIPMLVSIARGRVPDPGRWRRARALLAPAVIVGIAAVSVYAGYVVERPLFTF